VSAFIEGALDVAFIAVEGACDRIFGRPRQANPYSYESARDGFEGWLFGWDEAGFQLELRGAQEAARWLGGTA
jgi:hypothetical protein